MVKKRHSPNETAAPVANGLLPFKVQRQDILVSLIDPPARAMRESMDEAKLQELIESIRDVGLINPIAVKQVGKRFEVLAGHRRLIAVQALGWRMVRCSVYPQHFKSGAAIKGAENAVREDVNAAEESIWLWHVLETECGGDVLVLCDLLKMRQPYVEARLNLKTKDEKVFDAILRGEISLNVAAELNKVLDPARRVMYLSAVVEGGYNARTVREWRAQGNAIDALNPTPLVDRQAVPNNTPYEQRVTIECAMCHEGPQVGAIETLFVHQSCGRVLRKVMDRLYENAGSVEKGETDNVSK